MIALCPTARLGVDLEQRRPRPKARRLVERLFAPAERDLLLPLPAAAFDAGFSRLWVLKEAYIKNYVKNYRVVENDMVVVGYIDIDDECFIKVIPVHLDSGGM